MFERKKVGLALGEGGAKGIAHIGVLKILEKYSIPIDFISGTSMGAVIAALYSANPNAKKLEKDILEINWKKIFDYTLPTTGFIKGERIEKILEEKLKNVEFKDVKIPLFITAFDLKKKQEVIFNKGNVAKAVRASISIPGIFIPVQNKSCILVDGGVIDPIPTEVLKKAGADIIIAVNVDYQKEKTILYDEAIKINNKRKIPNILKSTSASLSIINSESCKADLKENKADFIININLEKLGMLQFNKIKKTIKEGEKAASQSLEEIQNLTENNLFKQFLDEIKNLRVGKIIQDIKEEIKAN